jgi:NADH:ubiquinone oxidoreductase subunit 6 (subunit J)
MKLIGVLVILAGWALAVAGLFVSDSNTVRGAMALLGIAVSFFGIFGVLNQVFLKTANWKQ